MSISAEGSKQADPRSSIAAALRLEASTATGGAKCWGNNLFGALGDGTLIDRLTPVDVVGLQGGVAAVSAGHDHTCGVTTLAAPREWLEPMGREIQERLDRWAASDDESSDTAN